MRFRGAAPVAIKGMIAGIALGMLTVVLAGNTGSLEGANANPEAPAAATLGR